MNSALKRPYTPPTPIIRDAQIRNSVGHFLPARYWIHLFPRLFVVTFGKPETPKTSTSKCRTYGLRKHAEGTLRNILVDSNASKNYLPTLSDFLNGPFFVFSIDHSLVFPLCVSFVISVGFRRNPRAKKKHLQPKFTQRNSSRSPRKERSNSISRPLFGRVSLKLRYSA